MPVSKTLVREWAEASPTTPDEITEFYRTSQGIVEDVDSWHDEEGRQDMTDIILEVVRQEGIKTVVDIGCGTGHDLATVSRVYPDVALYGIEPNDEARERAGTASGATMMSDLASLPRDLAAPALFVIVDVLEHLPQPKEHVAEILDRMPVGSFLIERTATHDIANPTHLKENWGWRPDSQIIQAGCWPVERLPNYLTVWERKAFHNPPTQSIVLCCYRAVQVDTCNSIMTLLREYPNWGVRIHGNDALVQRVRSAAASQWWRETGDDVFVMLDDDIVFKPRDMQRLVDQCRETRGIVGGAYVVRNGQHLASRIMEAPDDGIAFGVPGPLVEAEYVATGFMAVHRDVLDALIPTLPLVHPHMDHGWWPLFMTSIVTHQEGFQELLSEDWHFCRIAKEAGFSIHIDPAIRLGHIGLKEYTVDDIPGAVIGSRPL